MSAPTSAERSALDLYGHALRQGSRLVAHRQGGGSVALPLARWLDAPSPVDVDVLAGAHGPVLDVGCGPGRHLVELRRRSIVAMGIDICRSAVDLARERGLDARHASVFDRLAPAGPWRTILLLDGNLGIGADPCRLLRRVRALLAPRGEVLAELAPPGMTSKPLTVHLQHEDEASLPFRWAQLSVSDADAAARAAGLDVRATWTLEGRWFARLGRP